MENVAKNENKKPEYESIPDEANNKHPEDREDKMRRMSQRPCL